MDNHDYNNNLQKLKIELMNSIEKLESLKDVLYQSKIKLQEIEPVILKIKEKISDVEWAKGFTELFPKYK